MKTLLVTGFGPFPGWERNPTPAMVRAVAKARLPGVRVVPHVFNTVYAEVARDLPPLIAQVKPDAVLLFGLAGRTGHIRIERHAHNVTTLKTPDASGAFNVRPDIADGELYRRVTGFRTGQLVAELRRAGLHARLSDSAGQYLCNFSYWHALEAVEQRLTRRALFVHVPLPRRSGPSARGDFTRRLTEADLAEAAVRAARAITA